MDLGLLLLRATIGLTIAAHGAQKTFGWFGGYGPDGTGQFLETMGFRPGRRHALLAGYTELLGGLLLAVGLLSPLAAALIASVMLVAAATAHWKNGFFSQNGGYEYNLVLGVAALTVAFTGPGVLSIDSIAGLTVRGVEWGLGAAAVAVLGMLGQLAQRRNVQAGSAGHVGTAAAGSHAS